MREGILERDTESLTVYTHDYYEDVELPKSFSKYQQEELANELGITLDTIKQYISKKRQLVGKSLYKLTKQGGWIRLL